MPACIPTIGFLAMNPPKPVPIALCCRMDCFVSPACLDLVSLAFLFSSSASLALSKVACRAACCCVSFVVRGSPVLGSLIGLPSLSRRIPPLARLNALRASFNPGVTCFRSPGLAVFAVSWISLPVETCVAN